MLLFLNNTNYYFTSLINCLNLLKVPHNKSSEIFPIKQNLAHLINKKTMYFHFIYYKKNF